MLPADVFPAPAGMNRRWLAQNAVECGVPRASGDEPIVTRGRIAKMDVFPAPAGMNRGFLVVIPVLLGVPRASGDEPSTGAQLSAASMCSPRQRG